MSIQFSNSETMLDAVATTTTSEIWDVSKRQLLSVEFVANTYSSGSGTFSISVSNDGVNFVSNIAFLDATAIATGTSVTQKAISATATPAMAIIDPSFRYIKVTCTVAGTGTYSAFLESKG
jgi:hypothetical protein